ncbi:MAG: DUF2760 domain-containing protein [Acidobacteria bacterium]|nr:MAG: DUF2760 domain-containing protein [Acidobacteriota bacterium]
MTVWTRIKLAFAAFFTILFNSRLPVAFQPASHAGAPAQPLAADTSDRAIQVLALLQREGRLIDFALEDLAAYSDAQIGAAARDVHAGCHRVLERYVTLEAILPGREGEAVTIGQDQQVDPAAFHLVGNVAGQPPFRGTLLHPGWRASRVQLPPVVTTDRTIVAPAEIELA